MVFYCLWCFILLVVFYSLWCFILHICSAHTLSSSFLSLDAIITRILNIIYCIIYFGFPAILGVIFTAEKNKRDFLIRIKSWWQMEGGVTTS